MGAYKLWVRMNRDLVHSLESLANGLPWILPERFGNSEIGPEAVYALVGIVSCVNQHMLNDGQEQSIPWALVVSILRDAEAVVEVAARHFVGDDRKWRFLAVTEAVKACVRLAAFRESGYKMLLQGGEVENGEEDFIADQGNAKTMPTLKPWRPRLFVLGEAVNILRPLVYVLMITKFGIRSWKPWLVSLALELTSLGIHSHLLGLKVHQLSSPEMDELKRRKMMCALYAMRDPFFGNYTKPHLEKAQKALNPVPVIFIGNLVYLLEGTHSRYTYTSGS